jgi:nitrogen fixation/metabolism regulation signal transduction histidine kinase
VHYRLEQVDQIPSEALKPLEQLKQSGEHIHELTAAIRRLLRNDAAVQRMDLSDLLRRCLLPLQRTALDAGIQLQLDGLHQSAFVMGDSQQLAIAINNLLRNAEHSLLEVAPAQRLLRVALSQAHGRIVVHIADSGAGLPSNDPEALTLNSHKSGGMGLGVLMVRSIARGHGGELQLGTSTDLGGAEVSLSFPAAP